MKKFYTIAAALCFGALGLTASAAVTDITPTVNPISGTEYKGFPTGDAFVMVSWNGNQLAINPEAEGYQEYSDALNLSVYVDGEQLVETGFWGPDPVYAVAQLNEAGNALQINVYSILSALDNMYPGQTTEFTFTLPAGAVLVGASADTSTELELSYSFVAPQVLIPMPNPQNESTLTVPGVSFIFEGEVVWADDDAQDSAVYYNSPNPDYDTGSGFGLLSAEYLSLEYNATDDETTLQVSWPDCGNGWYYITLQPGKFVLVSDESVTNKESEYSYFLKVPATALTVKSTSPVDGGVTTYPSVDIYFNTELAKPSETPYAMVYAGTSTEGKAVAIGMSDYDDESTGQYYATDMITVDWQNAYPDVYGPFKVVVPAETFAAQENTSLTNAEIVLNVTYVKYNNKYVISPSTAGQYNAADLTTVSISWEDAGAFMEVSDDLAITYDLWGEDTELEEGCVVVDKEAGIILLDLSNLQDGNWTFTVPQGYVTFGEYYVNQELNFTYTVDNSSLSSAEFLNVENYSVITDLVPFDLTWNFETVSPTEAGLSATVSYMDADWNAVSIDVPASAFSFRTLESGPNQDPGDQLVPAAETMSGNILSIDLSEVLDGLYESFSLYIPAGIVANKAGLENPEQYLSFEVVKAYDEAPLFTWNEADQTLTFTYDTDEDIEVSAKADANITLETANAAPLTLTIYSIWNPEGRIIINYNDEITFNLAGLNLEGNNTLYLPAGALAIYGEDGPYVSEPIVFEFNITDGVFTPGHGTSGVNSLYDNENGEVEIYNLQGVKVNPNNLGKGLYIINGKKVMVK